MRWQNLFDDLEGQLESGLGAEEVDLAAEEERLRLGRLTLRDRILALRTAGEGELVTLTLRTGERLVLAIGAVGRDWLAGEQDAGPRRSAIVPLGAIATLDPVGAQLTASLRAAPEPPTALSTRLGLAFVLRDLARRRAGVDVSLAGTSCHGTIDRVGRDHLDLAEHAPGDARRAGSVARIRLVAFDALDLVRF